MTPHTTLLGGPCIPPNVKKGDWLDCEISGSAEVGGWSNGRIAWPRKKKTGSHSLIVCGDLLRAVKTESAAAIKYWWGVGDTTIWKWRVALGVETFNEGTTKLKQDTYHIPADASAKGRERAKSPESRAKMSASKVGVPAPAAVKAGLLRAAQRPKPQGWGKKANAWMQAAKKGNNTSRA